MIMCMLPGVKVECMYKKTLTSTYAYLGFDLTIKVASDLGNFRDMS